MHLKNKFKFKIQFSLLISISYYHSLTKPSITHPSDFPLTKLPIHQTSHSPTQPYTNTEPSSSPTHSTPPPTILSTLPPSILSTLHHPSTHSTPPPTILSTPPPQPYQSQSPHYNSAYQNQTSPSTSDQWPFLPHKLSYQDLITSPSAKSERVSNE